MNPSFRRELGMGPEAAMCMGSGYLPARRRGGLWGGRMAGLLVQVVHSRLWAQCRHRDSISLPEQKQGMAAWALPGEGKLK